MSWITHNLKARTKTNLVPFNISFNLSNFSVSDFTTETDKVCKHLYDKYGNNLYLGFSGGTDSEYILNRFIALDIPITPVIVSCPYNALDIQAGLDYCSEHNLKPEILQYGAEYLDLCYEKITSNGLLSPISATSVFVYEAVCNSGGKVIIGEAEPMVMGSDTFSDQVEFNEFGFYIDYFATDEQPLPFFCYNQEIFYSYIKDMDKTLPVNEAKCKLYNIKYRPKTYWDTGVYDYIKKNNQIGLGYRQLFELPRLLAKMDNYLLGK